MNPNELIELDKKHFIHPTSSIQQQQENGAKMIVEKGDGIYLTDKIGNVYIDAMSSLWNVNVGHGRDELADAAAEQMKKLAFSSAFSTFTNEPAILLAEKISSIAPKGLNAIFFTSGGSESNDSAIKLVRHYWRIQDKPEKRKIIGINRAYHGVAAASTSVTGIPEFWNMAGKMMTEIFHADNPYRNGTEKAIASLRHVIQTEGAETIAAFIMEPVQGAGGVLIPPDNYLQEVRTICDDYGILFIADEVITGFGRTGKWFGVENYDVTPDIISFAKGVSSGYIPLGGVIVSDHIHDVLKEKSSGTLFHGYTYSGHPTAAAVGLKNIEIIEKEGLVENSRVMGAVMLEGFKKIKKELDIVGDVRAAGLLGAMEFVDDRASNKAFSSDLQVAPKIIEALHQRGVICRAVTYEETDIVCFSPPLIINRQQMETMLEKLHDAIKDVRKQFR
ncbi:aspartate aminotransferase family protein [Oceanobacillus sp. FSL H7-0719]|uniref:aminotransferase family protein n=1 Tax=Oceanobacillus sp. FSL H7-0719 TaxID=2954507 RepID=UPI00324BD639